MKYILLVLVLVGGYALYSWYRVISVAKSANLVEFNQPETILGSGVELRYIAAGDSTASGVGASTFEKSYTYQLAQYWAQTNAVSYKNIGKTGTRTNDVLSAQLQQIIDFNPDVITLSIGANDRTHLKTNKQIMANYKSIIGQILEKTSATLYITDAPNFTNAKLLPQPYIFYMEQQTKRLNPEIKKLESDRVKIVNIHDFGWDTYPDLSVTFAADNFHPNDEGYNNWTNAFLSKIK